MKAAIFLAYQSYQDIIGKGCDFVRTITARTARTEDKTMRTIIETKEAFKLEELDERAQREAYNQYSECGLSYEWWDFIYDDVKQSASIIGIEINKIYFSGFSSQGDGACFEGSYKYAPGWRKALIAEYGQNNGSLKEVIEIAEQLQAVQRKSFYRQA